MIKNSPTHTRTENGKPSPPDFDNIVVESFDAAANITGYTREQLEEWRTLGCPAFRQGNRIHLNAICPWLADHPDVGRENSPTLTLAHIEIREALIRTANNEQKLAERRKLYAKGEEVRRALIKSWLAMKIKLIAISSKMSQPLALMTDPREIQQQMDAEHCAALGEIERNEWFDNAEIAKWLATQPGILKEAKRLAKT